MGDCPYRSSAQELGGRASPHQSRQTSLPSEKEPRRARFWLPSPWPQKTQPKEPPAHRSPSQPHSYGPISRGFDRHTAPARQVRPHREGAARPLLRAARPWTASVGPSRRPNRRHTGSRRAAVRPRHRPRGRAAPPAQRETSTRREG